MQRAFPPRPTVVVMIALSGGASSHAIAQRDARQPTVSLRASRAIGPGLALAAEADLRMWRRPVDALDPLAGDGRLRRARPAPFAAARGARAAVSVSDKTITEADLIAGEFMGQAFTLSPETTFDINDGGVMGPVGDASTSPPTPFDFGGSTVNLNLGGRFASVFSDQSVVSNIVLNVFDGGGVGDGFNALSGSTLNIFGGSVGDGFDARSGSTVNITGGSAGSRFEAFSGSRVNISGGSVGDRFNALSGSTVNITGGSVDSRFQAIFDSTVNISGGSVGDELQSFSGSTVNISGGSVGSSFIANSATTVNITGGSVDSRFEAFSGSTVNISGGGVGDFFKAFDGSTVHLFVRRALLDGVGLDLMYGETIEITQRGGSLLQAALADGSFFDLTLNESLASSTDFVSPDATLIVTRVVPAPGGAVVLGFAGAFAFRRRR